MMLNLQALMTGMTTRLRYVVRYSTCQRLHSENVAEHSYYVALYAMFIADWANGRLAQSHYNKYAVPTIEAHIDVETVLRYALLHDIEEAVTGDLPRSFKYSMPEITEVLHAGAEMACTGMMNELTAGDGYSLAGEYVADWAASKDDEHLEGRVVKFADYLAVLSYMVCELTNNKTMIDNWNTMHDYHRTFNDEKYDFIRELVNDAERILSDAFRRMN